MNSDFMLLIQRAALLGLKESGYLTEYPYMLAENALLRQFGLPESFPFRKTE